MKAIITLMTGRAEHGLEAVAGEWLSAVFDRHGISLDKPCGGNGTCKRCGVLVNGETRLACQTKAEDGMRVEFVSTADYKNIIAGNMDDVTPEAPMYSRCGLAVDIGTTTVCASLLDADGHAAAVTRKNPQTGYGADVISRLERALLGGAEELADCIRVAVSKMTGELCAVKGIAPEYIDGAVITGNTAMLYLLTRQNPVSLSRAPFHADRLFGEFTDARALGLPLSPEARIYLPRCVSAFVGGDITTAIAAVGMCDKDETALLVDIGTNGEIALWHNGSLSCCSTAAGPAFEGAGITHGAYGVNGAIDHVWHENGRIHCSTIGGAPAAGICGSGIVDAVAVMLELGLIDETGAFSGGEGFIELQNGIGVTASDVRKIQLAKGSIRAGIETLLQISKVGKEGIKTFYIAGGFGSFIDLGNAAEIGLIPKELLPCAKPVGNAAHTGAVMLLCDKTLAEASEKLASGARTIALDANPIFTENYMTCMMFDWEG